MATLSFTFTRAYSYTDGVHTPHKPVSIPTIGDCCAGDTYRETPEETQHIEELFNTLSSFNTYHEQVEFIQTLQTDETTSDNISIIYKDVVDAIMCYVHVEDNKELLASRGR